MIELLRKGLGRLVLLSTLFFCLGTLLFAQGKKYPQGYFKFPINPGQRGYLSGTMGELRSNHFHSGIDIKTGGQEGLPVYASADGYISRIKVSAFGYGNALYIQHPNGYSTVYAHLKSFKGKIGEYVKEQQYSRKSFSVELFPSQTHFKVKKGDIIGYSGNTGGSGGPHLHFEIRDRFQQVLNPLLFGFSEIVDNISPEFYALKIVPLDINSRVKEKLDAPVFYPKKHSETAYSAPTISVWGNIGLEIKANDKLNGASNKNGVNTLIVTVDGKETYRYNNDRYAFSQTRHINVHIDHECYKQGEGRFQRMYVADGNKLPLYEAVNQGFLNITDGSEHRVEITAIDAYGNSSKLNFTLKGTPPQETRPQPFVLSREVATPTFEVFNNTLKIWGDANECLVYDGFFANNIKASYMDKGQSVFLWDLRKKIPDSVYVAGKSVAFNIKEAVKPGALHQVFDDETGLQVNFSIPSLFDTLYLDLSRAGDTFALGPYGFPMKSYIRVLMDVKEDIGPKRKLAYYQINGRSPSFAGGKWQGERLQLKTRDLGTYTVLADTTEPVIRYLGKARNVVSFKIWDELSGIQSWEAKLNGRWLLMHYDYKRKFIWSETLNPNTPLRGKLELEVRDQMGNTKTYSVVIK